MGGLALPTLCLPAEKDGVASDLNVDHFQLYRAKEAPGTPRFEPVIVDLEDQFGIFFDVRVEKPVFFGTPTDKNGEGILDQASYLSCYSLKQPRGTAERSRIVAETDDQFGHLTLQLRSKPKMLCVPSDLENLAYPQLSP